MDKLQELEALHRGAEDMRAKILGYVESLATKLAALPDNDISAIEARGLRDLADYLKTTSFDPSLVVAIAEHKRAKARAA